MDVVGFQELCHSRVIWPLKLSMITNAGVSSLKEARAVLMYGMNIFSDHSLLVRPVFGRVCDVPIGWKLVLGMAA